MVRSLERSCATDQNMKKKLCSRIVLVMRLYYSEKVLTKFNINQSAEIAVSMSMWCVYQLAEDAKSNN